MKETTPGTDIIVFGDRVKNHCKLATYWDTRKLGYSFDHFHRS